MSTTCPQCGAKISGTEALCPACLKRVALQEAEEFDETEALGANDLLPETAQRKSGHTASVRGVAGGPDGERWGDYLLLEQIGRGAMGTVFKARHARLNRLVALKLISHGRGASEHERKRFLREAEAVARLQHPHIVTLYEAGEAEGQPYLAMEYVPGKTLAETIGENPLRPRQAAECLKKISEAVHYAHEHGVVHRDLKPSNVVLDLNFEPRVMDFGLARLMEQDSEMTLSGMVIGSPSYMAPEQAAGKVREVSAASDVYALGAILYEALTARPPFQADSSVETMRQVVENEPVSPRLLNANIPRDLETVCLKCLEKEPQRRYGTARDLAEDLDRFLRDEPILARPISALPRLARWCRRKPALAFSIGAAATLLLLVVIGSPIAILRINDERKLAEAAERRTGQQLYTALLEQARATVRSGELGQRVKALAALRRAAAISNSVELRREVFAALALPDLRFERELSVEANVTMVRLDPGFERLAVAKGSGPVEIRAVTDNRLQASLPASTNLLAYLGLWSSDGKYFAVKRDWDATGRSADLEVWELAGSRRALQLPEVSWNAISFHPQRPWIMTAYPGSVAIWDLESGRELNRFPFSMEEIRLVDFSPDGDRFVALQLSATQNIVTVRSAISGMVIHTCEFPEFVNTLAWHPGGQRLAIADRDGLIRLLDAQTGETQLLGRHRSQAVTLAFSPDGHYLMSGGWERELICWDIRARQRAFFIGLDSYHLQFSADGRQCSTIVRLRSTETTSHFQNLKLHAFERMIAHREFREDLGAQLRSAEFSPDGRWLAASAARRAGVWDLSGNELGALDDDAYEAQFCFSPDGLELFGSRTKERDNECFRWRLTAATNSATPPQLTRLPMRKPEGFTSLAIHSNCMVVTGSKGSQLLSPEEIEAGGGDRWVRTSQGVNGISPDGRWLAIRRPFTDALFIHRLPGLEVVATLSSPPTIGDARFSPAGDEVATCSSSSRGAIFWRTETWEKTRTVTNVIRLLCTPDARALWLTRDWRTAGLYDARTLELLLPLPTGMLPLALSPDGRNLAVSVDQRQLQVWDLVEFRACLRELKLDWDDGQTEARVTER